MIIQAFFISAFFRFLGFLSFRSTLPLMASKNMRPNIELINVLNATSFGCYCSYPVSLCPNTLASLFSEVEQEDHANFLLQFFASFAEQLPVDSELKDSDLVWV